MPKSKRQRVVSLTKATVKGREHKENLIQQIQSNIGKYNYIWIFSVENMRNAYLKQVRSDLNDSRFFFGRNKVMAKAFGSSATDEARLNLHKLSKKLVGDVGVLFTNRSVEDIKQLVSQYHQLDYARAGVVATQSVHLPAGELVKYPVEDNEVFPPNMEPQLRKLGIPTCLKKGKVVIEQPYVICDEGQTLNPNQAQLLKLFNVALADFQIKLLCYWNNDTLVDSF